MNMPKPERGLAASLLLVIGILSPADALRATPPVQAWVQRYPGAEGACIAVDGEGNVVVGGNINLIGPPNPGFIIKYSSSGGALWTNRCGYAVRAMTLDTRGNVYLAGGGVGQKGWPGTYVSGAYSSTGTPLWTNSYAAGSAPGEQDQATSVAVDNTGIVYVTGFSYAPAISWPADYITIAYSPIGTPLWTNSFSAYRTGYSEYPGFVAVDSVGHVYVSGTGCVGIGGCGLGNGTIAYSSAGAELWATNWMVGDVVKGLAVDLAGTVYVTSTLMKYDPYLRGYGWRVTAYSSAGTLLWGNQHDVWATSYGSDASAIAVGSNGNVYVTGYFADAGTGFDYLTLAYSSTGTPLWTNRYDGPGHTNDYAQAVAVGSDGTVYVTGYSWGTDSFYDYLTLAYSSDGASLWTNRYNGPANGYDQAFAMAVDSSGNIYVTGYSQGDCTTIKYVPAPSIRFSAIDLISGPACQFTITGTSNLVFRLEASTNLADWQTLTNYSNLPLNSIQYTDALAPDFPRRYYRTAWAP
jgi:hypothetical protein